METYLYTCQYCKKEFVPKRRGIQKFCSTSCRVRSHQLKTKSVKKLSKLVTDDSKSRNKIEAISAAGIGNAAIGTGLVEITKAMFTSEDNKPATKKDLKKLANKLNRYHLVKNLKPRIDGSKPYFDLELKMIVYRF